MKLLNKMRLPAAIAAVTMSAGAAQMANADIELAEGLTVTGFVDMSFYYEDVDGAPESDQVFGIDQVETNFIYNGANGISAQVDIEYGESGNDDGQDETFVEQAFITKKFDNNFSVKAGRFLSYTGWETEEPTGLYQYSGTGYGGLFYGGYQQGISGMYDGEVFDFMLSVVNDAFNPTNSDNESMEIEVGVAVQPVDGLTAKLFYITDDGNETDIINFWTSYEVSGLTLAFEYNTADYDASDEEADGFLLMANYASGDFGITARYSSYEIEDSFGNSVENSAITLAPSYIVSDNLALILEVRLDDDEVAPALFSSVSVDTTSVALEALFTF
ncbi:MAG: porin [Cellvibrionaceae bacterium]